MKKQFTIGVLLALGSLLLLSETQTAFTMEDQCLRLVQIGVQPGAWQKVKNFFASLSINNQLPRSRLIQLKADIIELESWKQRVIEIVEAHIAGGTSGAGVSDDLRLSMIPNALTEINVISQELKSIANDGELFAAEDAFKELVITLDAKRAGSLCGLANEAKSATPNLLVMESLVRELKDELKAISAAEEALGNYIKANNK